MFVPRLPVSLALVVWLAVGGTMVRADDHPITESLTLTGHRAGVTSVAFSADGKTIVTGGRDRTVRLWDARTGKETAAFTHPERAITAVALSPDGKAVAAADTNRGVTIWDRETGKVRPAGADMFGINALVYSADGKTLTSDGLQSQRLWDAETGKEIAVLWGHVSTVTDVAYGPDDKVLASVGRDGVHLWDVATRKELAWIKADEREKPHRLAFASDGRTIATVNGSAALALWDVADRKHRITVEPDGAAAAGCSLKAVAFAHGGTVLVTVGSCKGHEKDSESGAIVLWNPKDGKTLDTILCHAGPITAIAVSPDGKTLATASDDQTVKLWNLRPTPPHK